MYSGGFQEPEYLGKLPALGGKGGGGSGSTTALWVHVYSPPRQGAEAHIWPWVAPVISRAQSLVDSGPQPWGLNPTPQQHHKPLAQLEPAGGADPLLQQEWSLAKGQ